MGGGGAGRAGSGTLAQVPGGAGKQDRAAGDHNGEAPLPADAGNGPRQGRAPVHAVVAEHHAAKPGRQCPHRGNRVAAPCRIGEQP